jgi:hypothetical protein
VVLISRPDFIVVHTKGARKGRKEISKNYITAGVIEIRTHGTHPQRLPYNLHDKRHYDCITSNSLGDALFRRQPSIPGPTGILKRPGNGVIRCSGTTLPCFLGAVISCDDEMHL